MAKNPYADERVGAVCAIFVTGLGALLGAIISLIAAAVAGTGGIIAVVVCCLLITLISLVGSMILVKRSEDDT